MARIVTTMAAWQKVMSADPKLGFFSGANEHGGEARCRGAAGGRAAVAPQLIFNQRLDGWLTVVFTVDPLVRDSRHEPCVSCAGCAARRCEVSETPYQSTKLETVSAWRRRCRAPPRRVTDGGRRTARVRRARVAAGWRYLRDRIGG